MPVLDTLAQLYLLHTPARYARMLRPGARYKYHTVHRAPTPDDIHAHLTGADTIGVPLIEAGDLSYHVALDIDQGGIDALEQALDTAQALSWTAYAITSTTTTHCGGHLWIHLDQPTTPDRARQLAVQIAHLAQLGSVETYPTKQPLRIPFGRHTWTQQRGSLLLHDGHTINLDTNLATVHAAIALVAALPRNSTAKLPQLPPPPPHPTASYTRQEPLRATDNPIHDYNGRTDLVALLEHYGGRIPEQTRSGKTILHCPCGQHKHGDRRPSLEVQPARSARYGRAVAVGHAPGCAFYTEHHQVIDAFGVYCTLEGLTPNAAFQHIQEQEVRS